MREFVELAFAEIGRKVVWEGEGVAEQGRDAADGRVLVRVDPRYFRPTEVDFLLGDPRKAQARLGWRHTTTFPELVADMVASDIRALAADQDRRDPGN